MSVNFPSYEDVPLGNSPLVEVLCQVRFPPILRISNEEPSAFQEHIRERFPLLKMEQGVRIVAPSLGSSGLPSAEFQPKIYRFQTVDEQSTIALAPDFFAFSTHNYTHWTAFATDLDLAKQAVQTVYAPAYATRIGLRYINHFTSDNTRRPTTAELLAVFRPELTILLRSPAWSDPLGYAGELVLTDDPAKLTLRTVYGVEEEKPFFLLDFDYYEEGKLELKNLSERCDHYHAIIYRAFRWCLQEQSLAIFEPLMNSEQS